MEKKFFQLACLTQPPIGPPPFLIHALAEGQDDLIQRRTASLEHHLQHSNTVVKRNSMRGEGLGVPGARDEDGDSRSSRTAILEIRSATLRHPEPKPTTLAMQKKDSSTALLATQNRAAHAL